MLPHDAEARDFEVASQQTVTDGINAVRLMLARCWFDAERCARGLEALKQYRRE